MSTETNDKREELASKYVTRHCEYQPGKTYPYEATVTINPKKAFLDGYEEGQKNVRVYAVKSESVYEDDHLTLRYFTSRERAEEYCRENFPNHERHPDLELYVWHRGANMVSITELALNTWG